MLKVHIQQKNIKIEKTLDIRLTLFYIKPVKSFLIYKNADISLIDYNCPGAANITVPGPKLIMF